MLLGKRNWSYQFNLRLSLRHGFSRNPEGFAVPVYMVYDLCHDALTIFDVEHVLMKDIELWVPFFQVF